MSFHWCDNLHTAVFSPRDYQIELLAAAFERNTMICLGHKSAKEFIALKLLQELRREQRRSSLNNKISVYLSSNNAPAMFTMLQHLTDLKVFQETTTNVIEELTQGFNVYILHPKTCLRLLRKDNLKLNEIFLMILEDCHQDSVHKEIRHIFLEFYKTNCLSKMPKVLGLAGPLHSAGCQLAELSAMLNSLEKTVQCRTETASDIVTVLRYCAKPFEYIVQCAPYNQDDLCYVLQDVLLTRKAFLNDHRYDPFEIYCTDEFFEELKDIPDPKKEPLEFLDTMLQVLREMGPWSADRVAFNMYQRIEKQKIKTPHERHYILLCLVNTALLEVHSICEQNFRKFKNNHKDCVESHSSPKVLRLLEVLRLFKPEDNSSKNDTIKRISIELDQMDFQKLSRILETKCHSVEQAVEKQQLESRSIVENLDSIVKPEFQAKLSADLSENENKTQMSSKKVDEASQINSSAAGTTHRHSNHNRQKRRPFRRHNRDHNDGVDTLCSIIFCNSSFTARVLFELLAEMSRHDADLKFIKCQFTTDRVADPITEPKEAETEHRRQEEVLKRFRMHDCNVLIGTSVLEEGIDVPKCNLVVRWDPPTTYRSYVQCKGRARAVPAYHVVLVAADEDLTNHNLQAINEQLTDKSHRLLCGLPQDQESLLTDTEQSNDEDNDDDRKINGVSTKQKFVYGSSKGTIKILNPEVITNKHPSKPSAGSNIVLKEIKEIAPAIQNVGNGEISLKPVEELETMKSAGSTTENHFEREPQPNKATNNAINEPELDSNNTSTESVIESNAHYEVYNLDMLLEEKNPTNIENITKIVSEVTKEMPSMRDSNVEESSQVLNANKQQENTIEEVSKVIKDFEVFDLNELLKDDKISEKQEPIVAGGQPQQDEKMNNSPKKIKEQKYFQCLLHDQETEIQDSGYLNSLDEMYRLENVKATTNAIVKQMAEYREIEKMLLQNCANTEPADNEHKEADVFNNCIKPYKPLAKLLTGAYVDLSNSIALVNKYCAKLPSDTFTKLTPLWRCAHTVRNGTTMFQYTLRLPINSPLKYDIIGLPMPTHVLARRMTALQACIALHKSGELDNNLQPIGKEGFRPIEEDWENFDLEEQDEKIVQENAEPRPGTTKRRQYYYKRIASEFCDCRPTPGLECFLYLLDLTLQCPIPEEQNTRGRKIYPPEDAFQAFGILTLKKIPKVSSFPIFTRSGEVKVSLVLHPKRVVLTEANIACINTFINYTFTKVLRLKKFLMLFDPESTENCVFIVPTVKTEDNSGKVIDWKFLELIEQNANMMPTPVPEETRHATKFSADKFKDAVVMPWYRNQDQPHYFYVAEICHQLSPLSIFPSRKYKTFMHYYYLKYGLKIHPKQPLLDVDHTSARLNFLTPRYVNRKGVALPTSSEATKRAKRENLELKQILVPELCTVHPFPASLWRTAVCLPCILYRINGLLLADDIRKKVVRDMGLGKPELPEDKEWPMLDFGWSLSDVLKRSKIQKIPPPGEEKVKCEASKKDKETTADEKKTTITTQSNDEEVLNLGGAKTVNEIVEDAERKLLEEGAGFVEIGTWSNDMAMNLEYKYRNSDSEEDEYDELLDGIIPAQVKLCGKSVRATSPTFVDIQLDAEDNGENASPQFKYYDSDESYAESSFASDAEMMDDDFGVDEDIWMDVDDIVLTSKNEAETIETEKDIEKLNKQLSIIQDTKANERNYQETKNLQVGYNFPEVKAQIAEKLRDSIKDFRKSTKQFIEDIQSSGMLVEYNQSIKLPEKKMANGPSKESPQMPELSLERYKRLILHIHENELKIKEILKEGTAKHLLDVETLQALNKIYTQEHPNEVFIVEGCGDVFDSFNDIINMQVGENGEKCIALDFDSQGKEYHVELCKYEAKISKQYPAHNFSFDYQPDLLTHPGPSPSIILTALTMSNANDGINLERLECIGDSFLKYAITTYLYITYDNVHEGKLSHLRSKQVANLNLYRLGRRKQLGEYMIATKFEPNDNWLPPCYYVPKELEKALIEAKIPPHYWSLVNLVNIKKLTNAEICELVRQKAEEWGCNIADTDDSADINGSKLDYEWDDPKNLPHEFSCFIPYNLVSQHSIPDKSVADCVEALIGAYLIECGLRGALLFMAWLGIRVIPFERVPYDPKMPRVPGSTLPDADNMITVYGAWTPPKSPLLHYTPNARDALDALLQGYEEFENILGYTFRDRSYLLQAMTHASYTPNRLTDCYQRLEFLGDAVLDYLITRHLYEDPRQHSPGALTDLRSALVNNTIFASLAVRHGFHKYFRHLSPGLNEVIDRFVRIQTENGHSISEEYYLLSEEECDDAEDVEVPKALGDVFESVAGAIFLDSNMSLDAVWHVYYNMMRPEIEQFSNSVPKSPIRELLELEPETAKFGKPEKLADGRRVRVTVEVFCKGTYRGIGRNYRIAKCTAAKCALRQLKKKGLIEKR
ncbi:endoribonuclease Dcr-1 [Stomoxys calcitrans]|uniref:endoribonuclease Dcr-1 n=1 Tax=Stomoxys calcitrans TaxID=35570 RepID=UPI0027E36AF9|nr:endoribonuclease Dcr-1 [Stomoxys calcitrans]